MSTRINTPGAFPESIRNTQVRQRRVRGTRQILARQYSPQEARRPSRSAPRDPFNVSSVDYEDEEEEEPSPPQNILPRRQKKRHSQIYTLSFGSVFFPIFRYLLGILGYVLSILQPVFGALLAVFVVCSLGILITSFISATVTSTLCSVPGSSFLFHTCRAGTARPHSSDIALPRKAFAYDDILETETTIAHMVLPSNNPYDLPRDMRYTFEAIRNLRRKIKTSKLPSKAEFMKNLDDLIKTIEPAPQLLINLNEAGPTLINTLIRVNSATRTRLLEVKKLEEGANGPFGWVTRHSTIDRVRKSVHADYVKHLRDAEEAISKVGLRAEELIQRYNYMDHVFDDLGDIVMRDSLDIDDDRTALLAKIYTKLGGNSAKLASYDKDLRLLAIVYHQKENAVRQIGNWLVILQRAATQFRNLREEVGAPNNVDWQGDFPIDHHLESIEFSLERLHSIYSVADADSKSRRFQADNPRPQPIALDPPTPKVKPTPSTTSDV